MNKTDYAIIGLHIVVLVDFLAVAFIFTSIENKREYDYLKESIEQSGLSIVEASFVQGGGFLSSAPRVQYITFPRVNDFVFFAKKNNVSIVYFGALYKSDIFPNTYWFPLNNQTIVALNR